MSCYALKDPRTEKVRYVGRSADHKRRLVQHLARPQSKRLKLWLADLAKAGQEPIMVPLDGGTEAGWIAELAPDLNVAKGDDGTKDAAPQSPYYRGIILMVRLSKEEKDECRRAARRGGMPVSTWMRSVSIQTARHAEAKGISVQDYIDRARREVQPVEESGK